MRLWLIENTHREGTQAFITKWLKKNMADNPPPILQEEMPYEVDPDLADAIRKRNERVKKEILESEMRQDE